MPSHYWNFGNVFANALAQGVQAGQQQRQQEAINSFRQRSLAMQRDELSQRARQAQQANELQQQIQELRERQLEQSGEQFEKDLEFRRESRDFDPMDIPIGEGARGIIPGLPESVDPRIGGALISALGQANLGKIQMSQRDSFSPEVLRNFASLTRKQIGEIDTQLASLAQKEGGQYSPQYDALQQQRSALTSRMEGLIGAGIDRGVDLSDLLNTEDDPPEFIPAPESSPAPEQSALSNFINRSVIGEGLPIFGRAFRR